MPDDSKQEEVTMESIDNALAALVKATEATDLVRGYGIDQGGHVDERGSTSGGYPGAGETGGIDRMMIAKMQETLVDAGFDAGAIAAFMSKKDDDEEEEEEGGDDKKPPFGKMAPAPAQKSMDANAVDPMQKALESFAESQHIADAVDISPFMEDFVQKSAEMHADLVKAVQHGQAVSDEKLKHMAAGVYGLGTMLKSVAAVTDALNQRLSLVEQRPNMAKGATSLTGAQALHKSLPREVGGPTAPGARGPEALHKSEITSTLTYMNLEKGMTEISGHKTSELISMLEAGNQLHPAAASAVQRFLAAHPHEAETARRYH